MKDFHAATKDQLRNTSYASAYLQESVHKGPGSLYAALREVVQAHDGGFAWLAKQTGLGRASLYKALSEDGNPSYITIHRVLDALGLDLAVAGTYKVMQPTTLNDNSLIMDRTGEEYNVRAQIEQLTPAALTPLGSSRGLPYSAYDATNISNVSGTRSGETPSESHLNDAEQQRFRAVTQELYEEADAIVRQPAGFVSSKKAGVAEMIAAKHRRIGLKL